MKKNIQSAPPSTTSWLTNPANQCAVVIGIGVLIYLNTLNHGFVLDDEAVISKNKFVQQGISGWGDILSTFYWKGYWNENSGLFRPLSLLMFSLEWQVLPGNPFIHHFVHLLVYAALLWSLFWWLYELAGEKYPLVPFIAMLFFAAHPMHTEVVANLKSRDELLSLLFFSLSTLYLLRDLKHPSLYKKVMYPVLFLFALLSKEGAVLFLPVIFLTLWIIRDMRWQEALKKLVPFVVVTLAWGLWYFLVIALSEDKVPAYTYLDNSLVSAPDFVHRLATATGLVGKYIYKTIVPFSFSYDYSFNDIPVVGLVSIEFILSFLLVVGLFVIAYRSYQKNPWITYSILFFFITLSLASNVFKLIGITFAERLLFTPSVGFCILVAILLNTFFNQKNEKLNSTVLAISLLICLIYSVVAFNRNKDWKSNFVLYGKDAKPTSNSARVHYNYAALLLNDVVPFTEDENLRANYLSQVIELLNRSIKIDPKYSSSYINLGVAYFKTKNYKASIDATRQALSLSPDDAGIMRNLGDAYLKVGLYDSSIFYHKKCIDKKYIQKDTYNFLGTAFFNKKDYANAIRYYHEGVRYDSTYAGLWLNFGNALAMDKRYPEAISAFDKASQLDPSNLQPLHYKALTYYNMGDMKNADKWEAEFKRSKK